MSDTHVPSDDGGALAGDPASLATLRREAKQLLREARAGDAPVLAALRALLPRLAALDDDAARATIRLADVQHAIARRRGYASWAALKAAAERLDPLHVQAARFLELVRADDTTRALSLLDVHPAIAGHDLACACAVGDVAAAAALLAADPSSAERPMPPDDTPPLVYAVLTDAKRARGVAERDHLALVRLLLDAGASPNTSVALPDVEGRIPVRIVPSVTISLSTSYPFRTPFLPAAQRRSPHTALHSRC